MNKNTGFLLVKSEQLPWAISKNDAYEPNELLWLISILCQANHQWKCHAPISCLLQLNGISNTTANRKEAAASINTLLLRKKQSDQQSLNSDVPVNYEAPNEMLNIEAHLNWSQTDKRHIRIEFEEFYALQKIAIQERKDILALLLLLLLIKSASINYMVPNCAHKMAGCWLAQQVFAEQSGLSAKTVGVYLDLMEQYGIISSLSGKYLRLANVYSMAKDKAVLPIVMEAQRERFKDIAPQPKRICMSQRGIC